MKLPIEYRWLLANRFKELIPWYIIDEASMRTVLAEEFTSETSKSFVPFARRQDNDDVAGFVEQNGVVDKQVIVVHLTWSGQMGIDDFPKTDVYSDAFDWYVNRVIQDSKEWISEEDIAELIEENKATHFDLNAKERNEDA